MNIFIMVLAFVFMAGYYFMDSPSVRLAETELEYAIAQTDLHSIAECTMAAHTAALKDYEFLDICVEQYGVENIMVCLDEKQNVIKCEITGKKKPSASFIITSAAPIAPENFNKMAEILERFYQNSGTFGMFSNNSVMTGGTFGVRAIPENLITGAKLTDGQLVYITQFEIPDAQTEYQTTDAPTIDCGADMVGVYRFGRWQCALPTETIICPGDNIWNSYTGECVPDDARKPLCATNQSTVMVDDVWECVDPFPDRECPAGYTLRLNYTDLMWECVIDANVVANTKKCANFGGSLVSGALRVPASCTDCEEMITDPNTCETACVPSQNKLNDSKCYPNARECSGANRAFYFGFPNMAYAARAGYDITIDNTHSKNRKFNCLDCGDGQIDTEKSIYPFIAICK